MVREVSGEALDEPMSTTESIRQKILAIEDEDFLLTVAGGNMEDFGDEYREDDGSESIPGKKA